MSNKGQLDALEAQVEKIRERLLINKDNLDRELIQQPVNYGDVGKLYSEVVSLRDQLSEEQKNVDAELDGEIRAAKEDAGEKCTEKVVQAEIEKHEDHKAARDDYIASKALAENAGALREAFQQRAFILRDLTQLYIAGYWGDAGVSGGSVDEVRNKNYEKNRERAAEGRRRKSLNKK